LLTLATLHIHLHLLHHRGPAFDYIGVALAAFASWAGLPGPGEALLLAAGIFAGKHKLDISPVIVVAFVGATLGGIAGWLFGKVAGRSVLTAPGPLRSFRLDAVMRGEQAFKRFEVLAILLTPSWVAGIFRSRTAIYNIVNATSAAAWAVAIGVGAYYAGPPVLEFIDDLGTAGTVVAILLVVFGVGGALVARWRGVVKRQTERGPPSEDEERNLRLEDRREPPVDDRPRPLSPDR
jgi:membrane protein DedA with SNARE-associated domain